MIEIDRVVEQRNLPQCTPGARRPLRREVLRRRPNHQCILPACLPSAVAKGTKHRLLSVGCGGTSGGISSISALPPRKLGHRGVGWNFHYGIASIAVDR